MGCQAPTRNQSATKALCSDSVLTHVLMTKISPTDGEAIPRISCHAFPTHKCAPLSQTAIFLPFYFFAILLVVAHGCKGFPQISGDLARLPVDCTESAIG